MQTWYEQLGLVWGGGVKGSREMQMWCTQLMMGCFMLLLIAQTDVL